MHLTQPVLCVAGPNDQCCIPFQASHFAAHWLCLALVVWCGWSEAGLLQTGLLLLTNHLSDLSGQSEMLVWHSIASEMSVKLQSISEEEHRHLLQSSRGVPDDAISSLPALSHILQRLLEGNGSPRHPQADEKRLCGSLSGFRCC